MGLFPPSNGKEYILIVMDYVSKRVDAIPTKTNSHREVLNLVKRYIFSRYGCPIAIISNRSSHFNNANVCASLKKYEVHHHVTKSYHPQVNGQVEVSNKELKNILKKII